MATLTDNPNNIGRFTHMVPDEIKIWERFLAATARDPLNFDYDVLVGPAVPLGPDATPEAQRISDLLTRRRIDALEPTLAGPIIYEVKVRASVSSIGQLLAYGFLWNMDHKADPYSQLIIITDQTAPGTHDYARAVKVQIKEFPL